MTNLSPASQSSTQSDPASTYVAKRLSRRSAFRKAGAIGLAGALLLGIGVGAGHAAGGGSEAGLSMPAADAKDSGKSGTTLIVRGHGPDGIVSSMATGAPDTDKGDFYQDLAWMLDDIVYFYDYEKEAVVSWVDGGYVAATTELDVDTSQRSGSKQRTLTIDLWDHAASAEKSAKMLAVEPVDERAAAFERAADLNAKDEAEKAEKAK